ncbi:Putative transport protein [Bathymodiolus heckerae thiotrophic gill symbiont]|uniref:ABC transporter permease n=1 Tax=Bathymodiolus heckerae thiotrophic gill symbiont TaxID=1052212 RepID=UPI0010B030AC|nr:ABC transporter permease [Bathymodiolus heckerae thiotrophic gill symbiont]SMN14031.1 Putative transport protein [Bathymodiolus heckerae thiotrophic gill symbiont]SMN16199.1 Putative transport protein [uncultured Candidatus Thioglobus sp.]
MWIQYKTIVIREILRFSRIWVQTLFPPITTTLLYLLIFGGLMGERIGNMQGVDYLHFIIPGIILMTVIQNSYANTVASFFLAKFNHSIEELLVSPVSYWVILLGYVSGGVARGLTVGLGVLIAVSFFVDLQIYSVFIIFIIFLLTAVLFSLAGFINAIFAQSFDDISIVPTFILMPMIYLGGMFYSIEILPEFWQNLSKFNPIYYMVDGFRMGFLGSSTTGIVESIMVLLAMIVLLSLLALYLLKRGINIKT